MYGGRITFFPNRHTGSWTFTELLVYQSSRESSFQRQSFTKKSDTESNKLHSEKQNKKKVFENTNINNENSISWISDAKIKNMLDFDICQAKMKNSWNFSAGLRSHSVSNIN